MTAERDALAARVERLEEAASRVIVEMDILRGIPGILLPAYSALDALRAAYSAQDALRAVLLAQPTEPTRLFSDTATCVVCCHGGHPEGACQADDGPVAGFGPYKCGCTDYVTEEERGRKVVDSFVCAGCGHERSKHLPDPQTCSTCDGPDGPFTGSCTGWQEPQP